MPRLRSPCGRSTDATMLHFPQQVTRQESEVDAPGSARLELVDGVVLLDPEPSVFEAMLAGWAKQQRSRFLRENTTIERRLALVRRMADFTGQYPWQWQPAEAEAFISPLRSGPRPIAGSTAPGYEITIKMFCEELADARYRWPARCQQRCGPGPPQALPA